MIGNIQKMRAVYGSPIQYYLPLNAGETNMNDLLGKKIKLKYNGQINCLHCGKKINKSFSQGYCFPCFQNAPETEECVLRPELCRAHEGVARDMDYAKNHCLIEHFVYLSYTSDLKVGVTRNTQIPTRWIDQGAIAAIILARTPNRFTAGAIEVWLKNILTDKTNWNNMLKKVDASVDLSTEKDNAIAYLPNELKKFAVGENNVTLLNYPIIADFDKIRSLGFDKNPEISGRLIGIKGQYLIFETGYVLNIRKHGGYLVELEISG